MKTTLHFLQLFPGTFFCLSCQLNRFSKRLQVMRGTRKRGRFLFDSVIVPLRFNCPHVLWECAEAVALKGHV